MLLLEERVSNERALVLGGGGAAGNAWLIGAVAGLSDAGADLTGADLIIGTSAGATAAAQLAGATPAKLYADIVDGVAPRRAVDAASPHIALPKPAANHMETTGAIFAVASDAADLRRRIGRAALEADAGSTGSIQARWRATVLSRLPSNAWPPQRLHIVVIDAGSGERLVLDHESGVELVDAVAASTANGFGVPPYRIGERWYVDGGYPSSINADLAAGYRRILIIAPLGERTRAPLNWGIHIAAHVDALRASGAEVETILPDVRSQEAFGPNMMDPSARRPSAEAGYDQCKGQSGLIARFWR